MRETTTGKANSNLGVNLGSATYGGHKWTSEKNNRVDVWGQYKKETYEAGKAGWKRTRFFPSFVLQSPPPTLQRVVRYVRKSEEPRSPKITTGEENCSPKGAELSKHIADFDGVILWNLIEWYCKWDQPPARTREDTPFARRRRKML